MKHIFSKPNQITYIRILLIPIFVIFLLMEIPYGNYIAAFIFIILASSDALDGYIARKKREVSDLGRILDPIADKLLISAALIFLIGRGVPIWMAVVIIIREWIITMLRLVVISKQVMPANKLGKIKTITQVIAITSVIINFPFNWYFMLVAVIITVVSGLDYLVKMSKLMEKDVLNLPNIITTFRLLLIPLLIINLIKTNLNFALITFTIIILLDKLDGVSARVAKQITMFGRFYDAFVDFVVIVSSFITFYVIGLIEFFWILILAVPSVAIATTKIFHYRNLKEKTSNILGKTVVGISYVTIIAIIIDFAYKFEILVIIAILAYIHTLLDVYKIFIKKSQNLLNHFKIH